MNVKDKKLNMAKTKKNEKGSVRHGCHDFHDGV